MLRGHVKADNAMLADGLRNMKGPLEENADETEWLWDIVKERGFSSPSIALKRRAEQLEGENEDLRAKLEERVEVITPREDEKEDLADRSRCSDWMSKVCTAVEVQSLSSVVSKSGSDPRGERGVRGRGARFKFVGR